MSILDSLSEKQYSNFANPERRGSTYGSRETALAATKGIRRYAKEGGKIKIKLLDSTGSLKSKADITAYKLDKLHAERHDNRRCQVRLERIQRSKAMAKRRREYAEYLETV